MQKFIKLMNMTFEISTPKWLLEIGAIIMKTETKLFLKCSWVVPERLLHSGFLFKYDTFDGMLCEILKK